MIHASAQEEVREEIVYLTNSPNSHYYQIGEVASFALSGDELYYTNASHELLSYNLPTNTPKNHEIFDVTMLRSKKDSLFFISDNYLFSYDGTTKTSIAPATAFDYYEDDTTNTLCYLSGSVLTIASYDENDQLQVLTKHDFSTNSSHILENDIKAITATEKGCILISEQERLSSIDIEFHYLIPTGDVTIINHNKISDTYYDCSMIKYSKIGDQQVLALLYQSNIAVITIDDNLNWDKTDILLQSSNNTIYAPTYINFVGNSILASDKIKKDIKSFEIGNLSDSTSMVTTTLLGSNGSSKDQYQDVRDILVKDDNDLIINDAGNYRLKRITNGATEISDLFSYQSTDEEVRQIEVDYFNQTVILYYDMVGDTSYLRYYKDRQLDEVVRSLILTGAVQSFIVENLSDVYYTKQDGIYTTQGKIVDLTLTDSKLYLSNKADELILLDKQNAYAINTKDMTYTTLSTSLGSYTSAVLDYFNNIYTLNGNTITKYTLSETGYTLTSSVTLKKTYTIMCMNHVNGRIYLYDETNACLCSYYNPDFSNGMSEYEDTSMASLNDCTSLVTLANFTTSTVWVTDYPNHIGASTRLNLSQITSDNKISVVVLDKVEDWAHIAYYDDKDTLLEGYVPLSSLREKSVTLGEEKEYYVISKSASIYSIPSHYAPLSTTLTKNELVTVLSNPISDMTAIDFEYLAVRYEDKIVYVLTSDLLPVSIQAPQNNTLQNATIKAKEGANVYLTADTESAILTTLQKGTRIYAENYNEDKTWTKIKYLNANNEEVEGYILSKYIEPDNPSVLIILCVVLSMVAGVILIIILVNVVKIKQKYMK